MTFCQDIVIRIDNVYDVFTRMLFYKFWMTIICVQILVINFFSSFLLHMLLQISSSTVCSYFVPYESSDNISSVIEELYGQTSEV